MAKDHDRFNKFCETYDMYADYTEGKVVEFLKHKYPDAWDKALKEATEGNVVMAYCFANQAISL